MVPFATPLVILKVRRKLDQTWHIAEKKLEEYFKRLVYMFPMTAHKTNIPLHFPSRGFARLFL
eukprot:5765096-Amphidinium_carterae.1